MEVVDVKLVDSVALKESKNWLGIIADFTTVVAKTIEDIATGQIVGARTG